MGELFGTDGVRGVANKELTGDLAYRIGRAGAYYLTRDYYGGDKAKILIGKDTRISGDMLEAALIAGITSTGVDVIKLGIIPTPGVSFLTDITAARAGVMISASHNPIADNGIKFFNEQGLKLTDRVEEEIENLIFTDYDSIPSPTHERLGIVDDAPSLQERYVEHLVNSVDYSLEGIKVVLDCANGAAYEVAPAVLSKLGVEMEVINDHGDGEKINVNSGSTFPRVVKKRVLESTAEAGIAHDGDADRLIMVDEKGNILDGDYIMAILALDLLERNNLKGKALVTTRYSNYGLKELLAKHGAEMILTRNGDRYVLAEMLDGGYNLGGEKSGHIIYLDYNKTGDGILTAIQVLGVMKRTGKSLNELAQVLKPWPQKMSNVQVKKKGSLHGNGKINNMIKRAEEDLDDEGRIFIRASGTEPVVRVMLEGKDPGQLAYWEQELTAIISKELN